MLALQARVGLVPVLSLVGAEQALAERFVAALGIKTAEHRNACRAALGRQSAKGAAGALARDRAAAADPR